jgi:tRNA(fMet)-specific endonuclease VapC
MSLFVLDTDILTLHHRGHPAVRQNVGSHPAAELAIAVISVEEQLSGWYTVLRRASQPPELARAYRRLAETVAHLALWRILLFPESAIARYDQLAAMKLNIRKTDLRIAAIALENAATVVSRNLRDFGRVPGLTVVDWSV